MAIAAAIGFATWNSGSFGPLGDTVRPPAAPLTGRATVIDGDTVEIHGEHVRINGVDAPESRQTCMNEQGKSWRCGKVAANALDSFLSASRPLRCEFIERDRYGRFVGNCFRADGEDVAAWLVSNGHALDWPRYSNGAHASKQAKAKTAKTGIWSGTFEAPWDWRAANRSPDAFNKKSATTPLGLVASAKCRIKGNINGEGEHIYHLPGQKAFASTRVTTGKGERWFCSEAEAKAAGWRRANG
ncbi:MAG: thermonuclease family protein [Mesorhizobium sp.]|nr:thermonuclease family protein [Mesorhizobium sp.]MBL8575623.1 thermonuclease family protein [Mesorhizobium sp.]